MATTIHYTDFKGLEFSQKKGIYTLRSRCGMLRRNFQSSSDIYSDKTRQFFTDNPLNVNCSMCRNAISGIIIKADEEGKDIVLAKHLSMHTNTFFSKHKEFDLNSLRFYLQKNNCCYYTRVASFLKENNKIKYLRKGGNGIDKRFSDLYSKSDLEPIHYSIFIELIIQYRKNTSKNKKRKKLLEETSKIDFQSISDNQLADELRRRGFTITATKTIEL